MTDQFMSDSNIRNLYGLSESDTFENSFSSVSLESILFGIFASAVYVLEAFFDAFRKEVDTKIAAAVTASIPWYHKICLEYQHGDDLVLDPQTQQYVYDQPDTSKMVVKYASCRDRGGGVYILIAGQGADGLPKALSNDVLTAFKAYLNERKPAGVLVEAYSYDPDDIMINARIQYDPLVLNADGSLITDSSVFPVQEAIDAYLAGIIYGGTFNRTKCTDAIQSAAGVLDVILGDVKAKASAAADYATIAGNNYRSVGGSFKSQDLKNTVTYELQL